MAQVSNNGRSQDHALESAEKPFGQREMNQDVVYDYEDPFQWPRRRKWTITVLTALCTLTATLCSSIFSSTIVVTAREFETTETVMLLGVSLFVLGTSGFCKETDWCH